MQKNQQQFGGCKPDHIRFFRDHSPHCRFEKNMDEPIEDIKDWMYDEATCSQLVFMYGLIQHKFDGNPQDLFKIFGHKNEQGNQVLTVGSLDIGGELRTL